MNSLWEKHCATISTDSPQVSEIEIAELMPQVPGWQIITVNGEKRLQKVFAFKNFKEALEFTDKVGAMAEKEDHHPSLLTEWGRITVTWWTHKIKGLHVNDFIMAAKTDRLE
jgi:4a-hydroxytetrahydrobiopterin dehydratase